MGMSHALVRAPLPLFLEASSAPPFACKWLQSGAARHQGQADRVHTAAALHSALIPTMAVGAGLDPKGEGAHNFGANSGGANRVDM